MKRSEEEFMKNTAVLTTKALSAKFDKLAFLAHSIRRHIIYVCTKGDCPICFLSSFFIPKCFVLTE